jgi:hypothetical protein
MNGLNELNNARNQDKLDELGKIGHEDNPWKLGNNWAQEHVTIWGNGTMDELEENEQSKDIGQQMNS